MLNINIFYFTENNKIPVSESVTASVSAGLELTFEVIIFVILYSLLMNRIKLFIGK